MPDSNPDLGHLHNRINDLAAETRDRDSKIELRHERLQAQMEGQSTNMDRLEKVCEENTSGISDLKTMHAEMIRENQYTCKAIAEAKDIATAARDISENERINSLPLHEDFKHRKELKKFLTQLVLKILMPCAITGGLGAIGYFVWIRINGG